MQTTHERLQSVHLECHSVPSTTKETFSSWLLNISSSILISMLAASLSASPDISDTGTAAQLTHLDQPGEDRESCCDPHEGKHLLSDFGTNVEFGSVVENITHDDEHHCSNYCCYRDEQCIQKRKDGDRKCEPSAEDRYWDDEYQHKAETGSCQEETKHPMGDCFDQIKNVDQLGW